MSYTNVPCYLCGKTFPLDRMESIGKSLLCPRCARDKKPVLRSAKQPARNSLCPCNSGKKFKHCCLKRYNKGVEELLLKDITNGIDDKKSE